MNEVQLKFKENINADDHPEVENFLLKLQHYDQLSFILNHKNIIQIWSIVLSYFVITEQFSDFMEGEIK